SGNSSFPCRASEFISRSISLGAYLTSTVSSGLMCPQKRIMTFPTPRRRSLPAPATQHLRLPEPGKCTSPGSPPRLVAGSDHNRLVDAECLFNQTPLDLIVQVLELSRHLLPVVRNAAVDHRSRPHQPPRDKSNVDKAIRQVVRDNL